MIDPYKNDKSLESIGPGRVIDPYTTATDLLIQGNLRKLIRKTARTIECTPVVLLNTGLSLEPLVEKAITDGIQNHLCYILIETRLLARKYNLDWSGDKAIEKLKSYLLQEFQTFNSHPPKEPTTSTEKEARVKTWGHLFEEQYLVYRNDGPIT